MSEIGVIGVNDFVAQILTGQNASVGVPRSWGLYDGPLTQGSPGFDFQASWMPMAVKTGPLQTSNKNAHRELTLKNGNKPRGL
jgi:hypothetical protein